MKNWIRCLRAALKESMSNVKAKMSRIKSDPNIQKEQTTQLGFIYDKNVFNQINENEILKEKMLAFIFRSIIDFREPCGAMCFTGQFKLAK